MSQAADLFVNSLKKTKMHIADISQSVGYENQLHFSRAFKNIYGLSPMQWRKANRENT